MKRRIVSMILALSLLLDTFFLFTACGILVRSDDAGTTQTGNEGKVAASREIVNQIKNAKDISPANPILDSWKDEDGNRYYVIYLGKIEYAEIYNIESFYYSNDFEELKITEERITVESLSKSYRNTVTSSVGSSTTAYIKNTMELEAGEQYGIASARVRDSFETGLEERLELSCTEQNESIYTTVVTSVRRDVKEKTINFKNACAAGKYYRYSVCADLDCYMNLFVPAGAKEASYDIYSTFDSSRAFTVLLESDTHNGFFSDERFDLSGINPTDLKLPDKIQEAHPELLKEGARYDKINVGYSLGILSDHVYLDISDIYDQAVQNGGYSKVSVKATFKSNAMWTLIPRDIEGYLGYCEDTDNAFGYSKWCSLDEGSSISGEIDLKYFSTNKKVYLIFHIPTYAYAGSFEISDIEMTVKIS